MNKKTYKFKGNNYLSLGELDIAKFLDSMNIEFEYEFPIAVVDQDKTKIWYPDFYLTQYQIVIEYFGMYNHNEQYRLNAEHKKEVYKNCGIQFVPLYSLHEDSWQEYILKTILTHLDFKKNKMEKNYEILKKKNNTFISKFKKTIKNKFKFKK